MLFGNLGAHGTETAIVSPSASYNVQAPTGISIIANTEGVMRSIYSPPSTIYLGLTSGGQNGTGIVFAFNATVPPGGAGLFGATQLFNPCRKSTVQGIIYYDNSNPGKLALDQSSLYANRTVPTTQAWVNSDSPYYKFPSYPSNMSQVTFGASAQTYFIYQPTGVGAGAGKSVWDPLGYLLWSFYGVTKQTSPNVWSTPIPSKPSTASEHAIGTIPQWTSVITGGSSSSGTTDNCS